MDRKFTPAIRIAMAMSLATGVGGHAARADTATPGIVASQVTPEQLQSLLYAPWTKFCLKGEDANAKQVCFTGKDGRIPTGQPVVAVVVIEPQDGSKKIIRVTVPLGVQLTHGTRIVVDDKPPAQAPYVVCFANGCMSDYDETPEWIANFRNGKQLTVQAINADGKPMSLPLPLGSEFARAFDGPPTDPKEFEENQKKLQAELQRRSQAAAQKPASNPVPVATTAPAPTVVATAPTTVQPAMPPPLPLADKLPSLERRVALVIGNASYKFMPTLTNPKNDAADVEATLKTLGFDTIMATDLDRGAMNAAVSRFSRKVAGADIALVYYSGHGMQFAGRNYLLPTDASLETADDVNRFQLMPVDDLIDVLASAKGLQLIVLDACRNNPVERDFKNKVASASGGSRDASQTRGFSRIDARSGLVVTFATAANDVASDGTGRNSPFTKAFLKNVVTPDLEVRQMLYRVQSDVYASTTPRQLPEITSQYVGPDIRLRPTSSK